MAFEDQRKHMYNPLPTRQQILKSLEEEEFDILVIGGGATGSGVALDAVTRGSSKMYGFVVSVHTCETVHRLSSYACKFVMFRFEFIFSVCFAGYCNVLKGFVEN